METMSTVFEIMRRDLCQSAQGIAFEDIDLLHVKDRKKVVSASLIVFVEDGKRRVLKNRYGKTDV